MTGINAVSKDKIFVELCDGIKWYLGRDDNEMEIEQIAYSLSGLARFTGAAKRLNGHVYTVAEHSVKLSYLVETLTALMHDAVEVITNDMSSPVKVYTGEGLWRPLADKTEVQLAMLFGLDLPRPPEIKQADIYMVLIESFDLLKSKGKDWPWLSGDWRSAAMKLYIDRPELRAECWSPEVAYDRFMQRYETMARLPRTPEWT